MNTLLVIIDDDKEDIEFLKTAFLEIDPTVKCISFTSSQDALQTLSSQDSRMPDIICVDYNMPVLNGLDCLRLFRALNRLKRTKIVANSSHLPASLEQSLLEHGASFVFEKPNHLNDYEKIADYILNTVHVSHAAYAG